MTGQKFRYHKHCRIALEESFK